MLPLDFSGLDPLITPALVCSADGTVVYKNPAARRHVPRPKSNFSLTKHMSAETREALITPLSKPTLLSLSPTPLTPYRHAWVLPFSLLFADDHLTPELSGYTLWFFPAQLQLPPPLSDALPLYHGDSRPEDYRVLRSLLLAAARPFTGDITAISMAEEQLIRSVQEIQPLRFSHFAAMDASAFCQLVDTFAAQLLSRCHIRLESAFEDFGCNTFLFADSATFALVYIKLLLFLASLSSPSQPITASTLLIGGWIEIESETALSRAAARAILAEDLPPQGDLRVLARALPQRFLTVLDVCSLCRLCGFELHYQYHPDTARLQLILRVKSLNNTALGAEDAAAPVDAEALTELILSLLL